MARRRFDEGVLGAVLVVGGLGVLAGGLFALGYALRVVDDQLADID